MLFALAWANQKIWILVPSYIIGSVAGDYSFGGIMSVLVCSIILCCAYYIHISIKKPIYKWELFTLAFFSQTARIIFDMLGGDVLKGVLSPLIGIFYLYLLLIILLI